MQVAVSFLLFLQLGIIAAQEDIVTTIGDYGYGKRLWADSVLGPNNILYGIPSDARQVVRLDPVTGLLSLIGPNWGTKAQKWNYGSPTSDGGIIAFPDTSTTALRIDTLTDTVATINFDSNPAVLQSPWSASILVGNTTLIGVPFNSGKPAIVDSTKRTGTYLPSATTDWGHAWIGGILAANGMIYCIPYYAATVLRIDPNARSTSTFGSLGTRVAKWSAGVVAPDGSIFGIPCSSPQVLQINTTSDQALVFGDLGLDYFKWSGGALGPDKIIYGVPYNSQQVLRINPATLEISQFGKLSNQQQKWTTPYLARNGLIYALPCAAVTVLRINPFFADVAELSGFAKAGDELIADKWPTFVVFNDTIYAFPLNGRSVLWLQPGGRPTSTKTLTVTVTTTTTTTTTTLVTNTTTGVVIVVPPPPTQNLTPGQIAGIAAGASAFALLCIVCNAVALMRRYRKKVAPDTGKLYGKGDPNLDHGSETSTDCEAELPFEELLHGRLAAEADAEVTPIAPTQWCLPEPVQRCKEDLARNSCIKKIVPRIDVLLNDVGIKVFELNYSPVPISLDLDCRFAIAAYTYDFRKGGEAGNLWFELNRQLKQRSFIARQDMLQTWGVFMHHLMKGLARLPDWEGECYKGCPDKNTVLNSKDFEPGRMVQFNSFRSATTATEVVLATVDKDRGLIFRIWVTTGKVVKPYAYFPADGEVLLTPDHRFWVLGEPYEMNGYVFLELKEAEKLPSSPFARSFGAPRGSDVHSD